MAIRTRFVSTDPHYLNRRTMLRHHRAEVAHRLRVLRSRGIKVRTIWKGCTWIVLSDKDSFGARSHISTINARIDGVFVDVSPTRAATEYAEQIVSFD